MKIYDKTDTIKYWQKRKPYGAASESDVQELIDYIYLIWNTDYGNKEIITPKEANKRCCYLSDYGDKPYYYLYTGGWSENKEIIYELLNNKKALIFIDVNIIGAVYLIRSKY